MKKFIILLILAILLISALSGCDDETLPQQTVDPDYRSDYMKNPENLDSAIVLKMREDFQTFLIDWLGESYRDEFTLDTIHIQQYFGSFNGCEVVYMGSDLQHTDALRPVEVVDYTIVFPSGQEVYVYKDSAFYTVKEAYETGLIPKEDVYNIGLLSGIDFKEQNTTSDVKEILKKAPSLYVSLGTDSPPIKAIQLTTSWDWVDENGNGGGYEADSPHALQLHPSDYNECALRLVNENDELVLQFSDEYPPQSVSIQRWLAEYAVGEQNISDPLNKSETIEINGNILHIKDNGQDYIYEVYARWVEGSSYYAFRVDCIETDIE